MTDQQWDDYIRRQPMTFWGEWAREQDEKCRTPATPIAPPAISRPAARAGSGAADWSFTFALLGFVLAAGYVSAQGAEPGGVLAAGLIAGLLAGRLFKLILGVAVVAFIVWIGA